MGKIHARQAFTEGASWPAAGRPTWLGVACVLHWLWLDFQLSFRTAVVLRVVLRPQPAQPSDITIRLQRLHTPTSPRSRCVDGSLTTNRPSWPSLTLASRPPQLSAPIAAAGRQLDWSYEQPPTTPSSSAPAPPARASQPASQPSGPSSPGPCRSSRAGWATQVFGASPSR